MPPLEHAGNAIEMGLDLRPDMIFQCSLFIARRSGVSMALSFAFPHGPRGKNVAGQLAIHGGGAAR